MVAKKDPFAGLAKTDSAEDIVNNALSGDFEFDFDAEFTIDDKTYEVTEGGNGGFTPYVLPAEKTHVAVEIVKAEVEEREMRIVVGRTQDGKVILDPENIDKAVKAGEATEEVVETKVPRFKLEVEHVAAIYGDRPRSFLMGAPVYAIKMAYKEGGKKRKTLGFNKYSGPKLIAATRVLEAGQRPNRAELQKLADEMVGKVVMAEVWHNTKEYTDATDRTDEKGNVIKALIDEHGSFVKVIKDGDVYVYQETGDAYDMEEHKLVEYNDGYVIRDYSDESAPVKDLKKTTRTFDNLRDDVSPVPAGDMKTGEAERIVDLIRTDGTETTGEVTWDTVSQLVKREVGKMAQAVVEGGEVITINWIGTAWVETPEPHALQLSATGALEFVTTEGGLSTFAG